MPQKTTRRTTTVVESEENTHYEIEHSFNEDEKTDVLVSENPANIANKRCSKSLVMINLKV